MTSTDLRARAWNAALTASPGALDLRVEPSAITGQLPPALKGGRLLWNGPGWTLIGGRLAHPFDGHGYLRSLECTNDGGLRLRARFIETEVFREEFAAQRLTRRGLGTNLTDRWWDNVRVRGQRNVA